MGLNGHLSSTAHTQICQGISYMQFIKFYSRVEKSSYRLMMTTFLKSFKSIISIKLQKNTCNKVHDLLLKMGKTPIAFGADWKISLWAFTHVNSFKSYNLWLTSPVPALEYLTLKTFYHHLAFLPKSFYMYYSLVIR